MRTADVGSCCAAKKPWLSGTKLQSLAAARSLLKRPLQFLRGRVGSRTNCHQPGHGKLFMSRPFSMALRVRSKTLRDISLATLQSPSRQSMARNVKPVTPMTHPTKKPPFELKLNPKPGM
ncbi:hypothetical protein RRG08_048213 [Elysia crispata]|uniref:Uncharacterized protein n=1 Tax=Elysia crispata TaxID=231223 RepID=A0AAE1CPQ6_9GAST|nr:hypothetical protein RRG08_048213 [Elysia crispata]